VPTPVGIPPASAEKRSLLGLAHACTDQAVASTRLGGRNLPMSTPHGLGEHASPVGDDRTTTNPPDGGMAAPSLYGERGGLGYNPARPEGRGLPDRPRRTEGGGSPCTAIRNMDVRGSNVGMKLSGCNGSTVFVPPLQTTQANYRTG